MTAPLFYELVVKPTFLYQLRALPPKVIPQVLEKTELLRNDPKPDAKNKKRLVKYKGLVCRIRSGDYRILYTFNDREGWVAVLGVEDRKDDYRKSIHHAEDRDVHLADIPDESELLLVEADVSGPWGHEAAGVAATPTEPEDVAAMPDGDLTVPPATPLLLPKTIDDALLSQLRVPEQFRAKLLLCHTIDDLIEAPVPDSIRDLVFDTAVGRDYDRVLEQPNLIVDSLDDLHRYYEGDLIHFLLQLDSEQNRFVDWAVNGSGPALIKGGPGTGKTIIALYRIRALIAALRRAGVRQPRILFTTYTNALVEGSRQMLKELLGPDEELVTVCTADKLARDILNAAGRAPKDILNDGADYAVIERARNALSNGSSEDRAAVEAIRGLNFVFLHEEIDGVIVGREHNSLESYLAENRAGRGVRLTAKQRRAIWRLYEERESITAKTGKISWSQMRGRAVELVRSNRGPRPFDGVLIDEAQDLEPTVIRMLVALCRTKDRLFLTADPNQSIYGSGFRWADVHEDLQFRGRTGLLKRNYRTTREVLKAADAFLSGAELELSEELVECRRNGQAPQYHFAASQADEIDVIADFVREATRELRTGLGSCAVLVATNAAGWAVAKGLQARGLNAEFMSKNIDLNQPSIKVITMHSAKGLEFPIVTIGGVLPNFPGQIPAGATEEEILEAQHLGRRVLYVAMTRAMARLLVVMPKHHPQFGPASFDATLWNVGTSG